MNKYECNIAISILVLVFDSNISGKASGSLTAETDADERPSALVLSYLPTRTYLLQLKHWIIFAFCVNLMKTADLIFALVKLLCKAFTRFKTEIEISFF